MNSRSNYLYRLGIEKSGIEGTGIGLVICKRLIEQMNGRIGFNSLVDQGSTFWVELPAETIIAPINPHHLEVSLPQNNDKRENPSDKYILYIEDNPANLLLVSQLVELQTNFNLISAHEPYLGLEMVTEHHPDLILLDINLPGINGYEVLDRLRQNEDTRNIPVIAISANAMPQDIEKALSAGFNHYITKPIELKELLNVFEDVLLTNL